MEHGSFAQAYHPSIGYGIETEHIHTSKAPNGSEKGMGRESSRSEGPFFKIFHILTGSIGFK